MSPFKYFPQHNLPVKAFIKGNTDLSRTEKVDGLDSILETGALTRYGGSLVEFEDFLIPCRPSFVKEAGLD